MSARGISEFHSRLDRLVEKVLNRPRSESLSQQYAEFVERQKAVRRLRNHRVFTDEEGSVLRWLAQCREAMRSGDRGDSDKSHYSHSCEESQLLVARTQTMTRLPPARLVHIHHPRSTSSLDNPYPFPPPPPPNPPHYRSPGPLAFLYHLVDHLCLPLNTRPPALVFGLLYRWPSLRSAIGHTYPVFVYSESLIDWNGLEEEIKEPQWVARALHKWVLSETQLFSPGKARLKTVANWSLKRQLRARKARLTAPDYKKRGRYMKKKPVKAGSPLRFEMLE